MRRLVGAGLLLAPLAGVAAAMAVPWPGGRPPDATDLRARIVEAEDRARFDHQDELLMAIDDQKEAEIVDLLQAQIDDGSFNRTAVRNYGRQLFQLEFQRRTGLGGPTTGRGLHRVHDGVRGGLDSYSCLGCHDAGGRDNGGTWTESSFLLGDGDAISTTIIRNPPALLGDGLIQALGVEMSDALAGERDDAIRRARAGHASVRVTLHAKGVDFGALTAGPDGAVDTSEVRGVSADLVVRPFGWKGAQSRLRRMVGEAARLHFGVGGPTDPDGDGARREIEEGALTAGAVYLEMLEAPVILPPSDPALFVRWGHGQALFGDVGCAGCHVPALHLDQRTWVERPDGSLGLEMNLLADGDAPRGDDNVRLFSDLRRHDMGPTLADPSDNPDGVPRTEFLTRPLWGVGDTSPYLHDGRAPTLDGAIRAHDGEARGAADAYAALEVTAQADLRIYLLSLTRTPRLRVAR